MDHFHGRCVLAGMIEFVCAKSDSDSDFNSFLWSRFGNWGVATSSFGLSARSSGTGLQPSSGRGFVVVIFYLGFNLIARVRLFCRKEKLLRQLILAANGAYKHGNRDHLYGREITSSIRYHPKADDMGSLDEFEMWKGKVFDDEELNLDVPRTLLASSQEDKRQARLCRLAVHSSQFVFKRLDRSRKSTASIRFV